MTNQISRMIVIIFSSCVARMNFGRALCTSTKSSNCEFFSFSFCFCLVWRQLLNRFSKRFCFLRRYHLIIRYYLKVGDYNSLINSCKRLGKMQPSLWLQALTGLRDNKNAPANLLSQILQVISKFWIVRSLGILLEIRLLKQPNHIIVVVCCLFSN